MDNNGKENNANKLTEDKIKEGFERLTKLNKKRSNRFEISIKNFLEKFEHKLSFDEYLNILSESIDNQIIETQKEDTCKVFVGGYIFFKISDDKKKLLFNVENYYKKGDEWFKSQSSGKTSLSKFDRSSSEQVLKDIWKKQEDGVEWKCNIDPPDISNKA